jgi:hypothetical protein
VDREFVASAVILELAQTPQLTFLLPMIRVVNREKGTLGGAILPALRQEE